MKYVASSVLALALLAIFATSLASALHVYGGYNKQRALADARRAVKQQQQQQQQQQQRTVHAPVSPCTFARDFTTNDLLTNKTALETYLLLVAQAEHVFHQDQIGLNEHCGHTYDGHEIDYDTGLSAGQLHTFSAASKVCACVCVCVCM